MMQSRPAVFITGVDLGSVFHQRTHCIDMTFLRGQMQSRSVVFITGVHIGPAFHYRRLHTKA